MDADFKVKDIEEEWRSSEEIKNEAQAKIYRASKSTQVSPQDN